VALCAWVALPATAAEDPNQDEMMGKRESPESASNPLFVDPQKVHKQRGTFLQEAVRAGRDKRPLYEKYLPIIGANGLLEGIQTLWPTCHSEAHDLGKVIFSRVRDIGKSLRICRDGCYSGCMHGILMEALKDVGRPTPHHLDLAVLRPAIKDLCEKNPAMASTYSPGDCAHGVGHALMFLAAYEIPQAIKACAEFGQAAMDYYCTTGAYMEYVTERDTEDAAAGKHFFYPCDTYDYPAACARYKMVHVLRRHYLAGKSPETLRDQCKALTGNLRLGCFHGLGNAHMPLIAGGKISIRRVCLGLSKVEEFVCIEGAVERLAKYKEPRAIQVCQELEGKNKATCLAAVAQKMYDMQKDLTLYLGK
jgi:hypothetical protein